MKTKEQLVKEIKDLVNNKQKTITKQLEHIKGLTEEEMLKADTQALENLHQDLTYGTFYGNAIVEVKLHIEEDGIDLKVGEIEYESGMSGNTIPRIPIYQELKEGDIEYYIYLISMNWVDCGHFIGQFDVYDNRGHINSYFIDCYDMIDFKEGTKNEILYSNNFDYKKKLLEEYGW